MNIPNGISSEEGGGAAYILQAVMNGRLDVQSIRPRVLRSDEHVLPREPALPHRSPGLLLVAVHLRRICAVAWAGQWVVFSRAVPEDEA